LPALLPSKQELLAENLAAKIKLYVLHKQPQNSRISVNTTQYRI
jgi:hypothetical protein